MPFSRVCLIVIVQSVENKTFDLGLRDSPLDKVTFNIS